MSIVLGIAGASRNTALALSRDGEVVAVCERERVTRTRRAAMEPGQMPRETLEAILDLGHCRERDIAVYAAAEEAIRLPGIETEYVDHHHGHAATAFYTSPFEEATILVCDHHGAPELTVWHGDASGIRQEDFPWLGPGFASIYSQAASVLAHGFESAPETDEPRLEALAQVGERRCNAGVPSIGYREDHLAVPRHFQQALADLLPRAGGTQNWDERASLAEQIQRQLGGLLLQVTADISRRFDGRHLCLGGGLFYNSFFTTIIAESGLYERTFVPVNPGNPGVSLGAAMAVQAKIARNGSLSPFLGPEFGPDAIKPTLDNCKLSYDYLPNGQLIDRTTHALAKGKLVGWFQGAMEWGPRALGHRSILASPVAPYVLENLNVFLKQRERHRTYSVAICVEDTARYFRGPSASPFMEYEYEIVDPALLRQLLPLNQRRLRVQTVDSSAGSFYQLIRAFGDLTGVPMLVNTSFNGFNEPIVCSPRDAIRVFYGTGLDMAVLDSFVLVK